MKKYISVILSLCVILSALSFGACGKKHTIDTDVELGGNESVSGEAGIVYENVTDENGENVTDAEGETVTVAVPAESVAANNGEALPGETEQPAKKEGAASQNTDSAANKGETATKKTESSNKKGETTTKKTENTNKKNETPTKKTETTTKKNETVTKKNETITKKTEAATRKNETITKKTEPTTRKNETTTKKTEPTTKKQEPTQPPTTEAPKIVIQPGDYQFELRADKTEVSPGDSVTVTLKLKNCKNVACFNIYVKCNARAGSVETEDFDTCGRFVNAEGKSFDIYSNSEDRASSDWGTIVEKGALFGGMISTAYSFMNEDLCTVTFEVTPEAKKGETLVFSAVPSQFLISPDSTGSATQDCFADIEVVPVMVAVK